MGYREREGGMCRGEMKGRKDAGYRKRKGNKRYMGRREQGKRRERGVMMHKEREFD